MIFEVALMVAAAVMEFVLGVAALVAAFILAAFTVMMPAPRRCRG